MLITVKIGSENLREVSDGNSQAQVTQKPTGPKATTLEIAPLVYKLPPGNTHEIEVAYKCSDLVEHFMESGLWMFKDENRIDTLPDVPSGVIAGKNYPGFSLYQAMEYESLVVLPKLKRTAWEKPVLDTWSMGTGALTRNREGGREQVEYRFTVQPGSSKEHAVVYGNQPRSMPRLIAAGAMAFLVADIAVAILIAYGIVFMHVDVTAGGAIILGLIGGEIVLKWLAATRKFAKG